MRALYGRALGAVVLVAAATVPGTAQVSAATAGPASAGGTAARRSAVQAAQGAPDEVIDSKKDPAGAAKAVNDICATFSNCSFAASGPVTTGYGPPRVVGDVLYNCSNATEQQAYSESSVEVTTSRSETTSISESVSLKISLGFIGLADSTAEFKAFSEQSATAEKAVSDTHATSVPPGYKGWTEASALTATVSGDAYLTDPIGKLIEVTGIDVTFPGLKDADNPDYSVVYVGQKTPLTAYDIATRCNAVGVGGLQATPSPGFPVTFCPKGRTPTCTTQILGTVRVPVLAKAKVELTQGGRSFARGKDVNGRITLTVRHKMTPGNYILTITDRQRLEPSGHRDDVTTIPVTITKVPV